MRDTGPVTNREVEMDDNSILVSRTDTGGKIVFANQDFIKISGFNENELIGSAHNIVRHRDMPKEAFKDLWETVKSEKVWQGFVKNKTKSGGFYWVCATIYPYKNENGELSSITLEAHRENEKREELVSAVNDAKRRALAGDIEVIVVDGGFDYRQVVEAADSQVCREKSCGPGWSFVLMPMVKLTPVVEQILFGKAASYARFIKSQTA